MHLRMLSADNVHAARAHTLTACCLSCHLFSSTSQPFIEQPKQEGLVLSLGVFLFCMFWSECSLSSQNSKSLLCRWVSSCSAPFSPTMHQASKTGGPCFVVGYLLILRPLVQLCMEQREQEVPALSLGAFLLCIFFVRPFIEQGVQATCVGSKAKPGFSAALDALAPSIACFFLYGSWRWRRKKKVRR